MQASLDYMSVKLSDSFTYHDWLEYAQQPLVDETSGVVIGSRVNKRSYKTDIVYKHVVLSCWGKDTEQLAYMALHHKLEPTRLDIKLDIPGSEIDDCDKIQAELVQNIKQALKARHSRRKHSYHVSQDKEGIEAKTDYFGARDSDSQIRIYKRARAYNNPAIVRVEFQLRKELAKSAWVILSKGYFKQSRFQDVFASLEAMILEPGALLINWQNEAIYSLDRSKDKIPSSREGWAINQVLPAFIKEFNETGTNLAQLVLDEFNLHFSAGMQSTIQWEKEKQENYRAALIEKFKDIGKE